jgi:SAM-dependent methyltransferase
MESIDRLEQYRRRYAALKPGWEPATALYQRWVAGALHARDRVLDLGCGRGGIVERLGREGLWTGIDPDLLSLRRHRLPNLGRGCARSTRLPFADAAFDLVVTSWVLEHLPAPAATFAEVARVLRPGGHCFALTPNAAHPLPRLSAALAVMQRLQQQVVLHVYGREPADTFPVHYRANTVGGIEKLAVRSGLRVQRMALVGDPAYLAWNTLTFRLAVILEALVPAVWKIHLVTDFMRAA